MRLSKSRFLAGRQCDKLLWLRVHEPRAPELEPAPGLSAIFATGHRVGERARAEVPGGTLIPFEPYRRYDALHATRAAIADGARVIYEACFEQDDTFVAVDLLERAEPGAGWVLVEVKSTLSVKPEHLQDLAVQVHVARRAGLVIDRVEVMHLNGAHRHPDVGPLFVRSDVTAEVEALVVDVTAELRRQLRVIDAAACPDVAPGPQCSVPYDCPFKSRCVPERPANDVGELWGMWSSVEQLRARGIETIDQLPDASELSPVAARQWRAVRSGRPVVEPEFAAALDSLRKPLAFLDFETIARALPQWPGTRPYQCLPVQHSVHRVAEDGTLAHHAYLAEGPGDPRDALAAHLLEATAGAATVLAWHAPFERDRIRELAVALPERAAALTDLYDRVVDLLPIVREHLYHPDFRGSFSLKRVGPALVPELAYDDLVIAEGATASHTLEAYVLDRTSIDAATLPALQSYLLAYCERDTLILVRMLEELRRLAQNAAPVPRDVPVAASPSE